MRQPICYGRFVTSYTSCQEWYETASRDAGKRARELRKLGYRVMCESMGSQVTDVGLVKMTLLTFYGDDVTEAPEPKMGARAS